MSTARAFFVGLLVLSLAACSPRDSAFDAGVDAGPPPPPPELSFDLKLKHVDGGVTALVPTTGERPLVDPFTGIELTSNLPIRNYRIRLFDEAERAVVSDDEAEDLPDRLSYKIALAEPTRTGFRYALVVDAQSGPTITELSGREHPEKRFELQIAGEKEKPAPKKTSRKRRR